jgi:hypothetical protein
LIALADDERDHRTSRQNPEHDLRSAQDARAAKQRFDQVFT